MPGTNFLAFRDGVPIASSLPGLRISLAQILEQDAAIDQRMRRAIEDRASDDGSESRVVRESEWVPEGVLEAAIRNRAHAQLVSLFAAGPLRFSFKEGEPPPIDADLVILDPLPILFEGLAVAPSTLDRSLGIDLSGPVRATELYPQDVDPFGVGEELDAVIGARELLDQGMLERAGLDRARARACLAALLLTGMGEAVDRDGRPRETSAIVAKASEAGPGSQETSEPKLRPISRQVQAQARAVDDSDDTLDWPVSPVRSSKTGPVAAVSAPPRSSNDRDDVARALGAFAGKDYYDVLRVKPSTSLDQLERAYRFLIREAGDQSAARRAVLGLYSEAYETLSDPERGPKYRKVAEQARERPRALSARTSFEAARKTERAMALAAQGALAEASVLLEWASATDPQRKELRTMAAIVDWLAHPPRDRARPEVLGTLTNALLEDKATSAPAMLAQALLDVLERPERTTEIAASLPVHPLSDTVLKAILEG